MSQAEVRRRQIQLGSTGLGLLTVLILGKYIGDNGITYLIAAIEIYLMLWTVICSQVPETLGRILRARTVKGQYKNADKMRHSVLSFQIAAGILGSLILFFSAEMFAEKILKLTYSKYLILLFAPVIFLRAVTGVLTGISNGEGSELAAAFGSVLRQICILFFGLMFSKMLGKYGVKVSMLLKQDDFQAMYGAIGVACAVVLAELFVLIFLSIFFRISNSRKHEKLVDGSKSADAYIRQVYSLYSGMGAAVLGNIFMLLPLWTGFLFYRKTISSVQVFSEKYGVYIGKYMVITGIIIVVAGALILPCSVLAPGLMRKDEIRSARNTFQCGVKSVMTYGAYFTVFTGVTAAYVSDVFEKQQFKLLQKMLETGCLWILTGLLLMYGVIMLTALGKRYLVLACLAAGDVVFIITMTAFLKVGKSDVLALVYALVAGSLIAAATLIVLLYRYFRCGLDFLRVFAIPMGTACVSGLLSFLLGKLLAPHLGSVVTFVVLFLLSFTVYWILLIVLRCFVKTDYETMPGGKILRILGRIV